MEKICYIAGPMRGLPDLGRENFNKAEEKLREKGWKVLNPAILPTDLPEAAYMPICLAMLREADTIVLLPGYEGSRGAMLEKRYAIETGKQVFTDFDSIYNKAEEVVGT